MSLRIGLCKTALLSAGFAAGCVPASNGSAPEVDAAAAEPVDGSVGGDGSTSEEADAATPRPDAAPLLCDGQGGGSGNFVERVIDDTYAHGQQIQLADFNGDSVLDVLVAYSETDSLALYLNGCDTWTRIDITAAGTLVATGVVPLDVDGDGDLDVAAVEPFDRVGGDGTVRWFENPDDPLGTWIARDIISLSSARTIQAGDLTGDGRPDLIVGTAPYGDGVQWLRNTGSGFAPPAFVDGSISDVNDVRVHDVDGDGVLDVVVAAREDGEIAWYENDRGTQPSTTIGFSKHTIDNVASVHGFALGNMDADPALELVATNERGVDLYDPGASPTAAWTVTAISTDFAGENNTYVAIGDFDGDSDNDIAVSAHALNHGRVYLRQGTAISASDIFSNYAGPNALVAADLDGDGDTDLLTSTYEHEDGSDVVAWWENQP